MRLIASQLLLYDLAIEYINGIPNNGVRNQLKCTSASIPRTINVNKE